MVDELVEAAKTAPQYDGCFLYELEYYKLRCMRAYFSHSLIADENGNFGFNKWIDICLLLLQHIKENGMHITESQLQHMNIRNVKDIVKPFICWVIIWTYAHQLMTDFKKTGEQFMDVTFTYGRWNVYIIGYGCISSGNGMSNSYFQ